MRSVSSGGFPAGPASFLVGAATFHRAPSGAW